VVTQERFAFSPRQRTERAYKSYVLAVSDAVTALSPTVAAGACGLRPSDLNDMIEGHKGRRMPSDIGAIIAEMVGGELRQAIIAALKEMFGMVEPESDADYVRRLEDGYAQFGEVGRGELARHRKAARRG
jgi:hypothetical protein